jgi:hypothetical protein
LHELAVILTNLWKNQPLLTLSFQQSVDNPAKNLAIPTESPRFSQITVEKSVESVEKLVDYPLTHCNTFLKSTNFSSNQFIWRGFFVVFADDLWYNAFVNEKIGDCKTKKEKA